MKGEACVTDLLCTIAANPGKDSVFPQHHPLPVCPEDISKTTFFYSGPVVDKHSRGSGLDGGLRAIPAEQLCQTARRTPQTDSSETDAGSPRCFVKRPRREETKHLSPAYCRKTALLHGQNVTL